MNASGVGTYFSYFVGNYNFHMQDRKNICAYEM
jgi:hypothetical protein